MRPLKIVAVLILCSVAAAGLAVSGYQLGWWLRADRVERTVRIENTNTGTQTAWRDEATDSISRYELLPEDHPARGALRNQACGLIVRLTPEYLTANLAAYAAKEC